MEVRAKAKHIKISPKKVRLVVNIIRGLEAVKAMDQLKFINKLAVKPIEKLLVSAIANAENNFELAKDNLYIKKISVDEGPTLHRWKPRARGRATPIRKRTSHIDLVLAELVESEKKELKKDKIAAPVKLTSPPKEDKGVKIKDQRKDKPISGRKAKEDKNSAADEDTGKKIVDPRSEGRGKHARIEGKNSKGFVNKIFRRKSG